MYSWQLNFRDKFVLFFQDLDSWCPYCLIAEETSPGCRQKRRAKDVVKATGKILARCLRLTYRQAFVSFANQMSDNQCAERMVKARYNLLKQTNRLSPNEANRLPPGPFFD